MIMALVGLTAGCSIYKLDSEDITTDYYPSKKSPEEVVYLQSIDRAHEIIGYVTVTTERRQKIDDVIKKIKREAAVLGGDAITDIKSDSTGRWKKLPLQKMIGNAYVRANFTAAVVVFK